MDAVKAVAIARDVLKQLRMDKLRTATNFYIHNWKPLPETILYEDDAQQHLDLIQKSCQVCAKGAAFLSYIRLYNKVNMRKLGLIKHDNQTTIVKRGDDDWNELREVFGKSNLDLIEYAFEGLIIQGPSISSQNKEYVESYHYCIGNSAKRLRAIMINVVRNKGVFKPVMQKTKEKV
jgi:hypothetical protein